MGRTPSFPEGPERRAALALTLAHGVGPVGWSERVARHGGAAAALASMGDASARDAALDRADAAIDGGRAAGAALVLRGDADYPRALLELRDAPPALWVRGDAALLRRTCVAVVGTRAATPYGSRVARALGAALARAGACVVSGLAKGVDTEAHLGALEAGGTTCAVLGTGVDVSYPRANRALHERIAAEGALVSELPCGTRATVGSFPARNRIIAGLSVLTIVVEAGVRSGALITATHALDLGRSVAAVPGPIDAASAAGSNQLLRDGAAVVAAVDDALALAGLRQVAAPEPTLGDDERLIWSALAGGAADLDTVTAASGLTARRCLAAVTSLELAGLVRPTASGMIARV